jgi:hypothetical protein
LFFLTINNCKGKALFLMSFAFAIFFCGICKAQSNLIVNGDFENIDSCIINCQTCPPIWNNQAIALAKPWFNPCFTNPDLLSRYYCFPGSMQIPSTNYGPQGTHSGYSYAGLANNIAPFYNFCNEYISIKLEKPLRPSKKYCGSFFASPADQIINICSNVGFAASEDTIGDIYLSLDSSYLIHPVKFSNDFINQPFADTSLWYEVRGGFFANGNEQFVTLGNFDSFQNSPTIYNIGGSISSGSYLFIDDVSLYELKALHSRDTLICPGSSFPITIKAYPGFDAYVWSNGDTNRITQITQPGTYWVTASNWCGTTTDSITIAYAEPQLFQPQWSDMALCAEQFPYFLNAPTQAYSSYQWSLNNTLISDTSLAILPGPGSLVFNAQWACGSVTDTVFITQNSSPVLNLGNDTLICLNNAFVVQGPTGYQYQWSNGSSQQNLTVVQSGLYALQITDSLGCTAKDTLQVSLYPPQNYVLDLGNDLWVCADDFPILVQCTNANFNSYQWSTGVLDSLAISVPAAGIYWLEANYLCGSKSDTIEIKTAPSPNLNLGPDTTLCIGQQLTLIAPDSLQYLWSNGSTDKTLFVDSTASIALVVVNQYGCSNNDQIQINYEQAYHQFLPQDTSLLVGSTLTIDLPSNLNNVLWNDGSVERQRIIVESGLYVVQVSDENDCLLSDSLTVNFVTKTPQLPGIITAGDYFIIRNLPQGAQIWVFDALGQIIYSEENYNNQWQPDLSQAVYFVDLYLLSGEAIRGKVLVMD